MGEANFNKKLYGLFANDGYLLGTIVSGTLVTYITADRDLLPHFREEGGKLANELKQSVHLLEFEFVKEMEAIAPGDFRQIDPVFH